MAIMPGGISINLAPLPSEETHHVRISRITGSSITFTNTLTSLRPATGSYAFRMIINRPEIQTGAIASEITSIGRRMQAGTAPQGHGNDKSVRRKGGVNMQITEQDLAIPVTSDNSLSRRLIFHDIRRKRLSENYPARFRLTPTGCKSNTSNSQQQCRSRPVH
ncbi:hypothetical protein GPB2148_906 [marine gamma proteobacterium HTCC2148]|nr:hypothetical protein GPB2148_906 [marine gamma proteobacterium HTCC2148]